jgi:hypothetical protein
MTATDVARALRPEKEAPPSAVTTALNAIAARTSTAAVVRTWVGTTRGEQGKTRVTFVWEPIARAPGDASRSDPPARVSVMAVGGDGNPYYRGKVDGVPASAGVAARGGQVSFEVPPGKMQLRLSVEGAASQVLDTELREVAVPDLTAPQPTLGTPALFRARTLRDFQALKSDAAATPTATREFSRTDRVLVRVAAYAGGTSAPAVSVHLLNRSGQPMAEVPVTAAPHQGEHQLEVPLSGLAPGEYLLEISAGGDGSQTKELVGFRVTG